MSEELLVVRSTYAMDQFHNYFKGKKGDDIFAITHTDMDGIMSGSMVASHFETTNVVMANYAKNNQLGFEVNESFTGKDIIITDYSFSVPKNIMDILAAKPKSVSIFDHHMNTLELVNSDEFDDVKNHASQEGIELFYDIDKERCGTKIIFDVLTANRKIDDAEKKLAELVDTYDRWLFTEEDMDPVYLNDFLYGSYQAYVMSPIVKEMVENKSVRKLNSWIKIGKGFHDLTVEMNKLTAENFAFVTEFKGYKVKAIEARGNSSLLGNAINEYDFVMIFHLDSRKGSFVYSLFKNPNSEADILSIAKSYGGGGHECACGFTCDDRLVNW